MRAKSTNSTPTCIRLRPGKLTVISRHAGSSTQSIDFQPPVKLADMTVNSESESRLSNTYESAIVDCINIRTRQITRKSVKCITGSFLQSAANYTEHCLPDLALTSTSTTFKGPLHKAHCFDGESMERPEPQFKESPKVRQMKEAVPKCSVTLKLHKSKPNPSTLRRNSQSILGSHNRHRITKGSLMQNSSIQHLKMSSGTKAFAMKPKALKADTIDLLPNGRTALKARRVESNKQFRLIFRSNETETAAPQEPLLSHEPKFVWRGKFGKF